MLEALSSCYLTNTVYKNSLIQVQRNPRSKAHYKSKSHLEFFCYQVGQTCLARTGHQLLELFWKFPADVKMIFWLKKRLSEILRHPSKRWRCQGGGGESERGKTEVHLRFHSHSHILKYIHFTEIHAFTFTHSLQLTFTHSQKHSLHWNACIFIYTFFTLYIHTFSNTFTSHSLSQIHFTSHSQSLKHMHFSTFFPPSISKLNSGQKARIDSLP